jgi:hypothetical protein
MARQVAEKREEITTCTGGRSLGCHHIEHPKSLRHPDIRCFRCGDRMGCYACVEPARELVCLNCNDWATRTAMRVHGPVVGSFEMRRDKLAAAVRMAGRHDE